MAANDVVHYIENASDKWVPTIVARQGAIGAPTATVAPTTAVMTSAAGTPGTTIAAFTNPPTKAECDDSLASVVAQLNAAKTDVAALKTAVDSQKTAIDALRAVVAAFGLTA